MQPKIHNSPLYYDVAHLFEGEVFSPIPGELACYSISNYGRVKSDGATSTNKLGTFTMPTRILRPATTKAGYQSVSLGRKSHNVHTLMRRVFMPELAHLREVDHVDGDKANNVRDNLECVTPKVNKKRGVALGLINNVGEAHGMAKLNEEQVWQVLSEYHLNSLSRKKVAVLLGLSEFTVKAIITGTNWKHVYSRFVEQHPAAVATDRAQTRLTAEKAADIRRRSGMEKTKDLALEYGVSKDTINKIRTGKLWA